MTHMYENSRGKSKKKHILNNISDLQTSQIIVCNPLLRQKLCKKKVTLRKRD